MIIIVQGGRAEADHAIWQCTAENGGKLVGDPTIPADYIGRTIKGVGVVTFIIVHDRDDPDGWWADWDKVHGLG